MFELHPRLREDCVGVADFALCQVLLARDSRYPWVILVPKRAQITEIYQLEEADLQQLGRESARLSQALARHFNADKMNVAALGNLVPQLHIHHVVRYTNDPAWPGPVWGVGTAIPYEKVQLEQRLKELKQLLATLKL